MLSTLSRHTVRLALAGLLTVLAPLPALAQASPPGGDLTYAYADLADLADSANLVIAAKVRKAVALDPARVRNPSSGARRYYVTATTVALIAGTAEVGTDLSYLVDLPLDAQGKTPRIKGMQVLLFARPVTGKPGEIQLVSPRAQIPRDAASEAQVRAIIRELLAPGAPPRITGVREAIHVPGALDGEGETQIFLATTDGSASSITVSHRAGQPPVWGVSFSELIGSFGQPPAPDTLAWYRLACFLPNALPRATNLSDSPASRAQAEADYRMVLGALGDCPRRLR